MSKWNLLMIAPFSNGPSTLLIVSYIHNGAKQFSNFIQLLFCHMLLKTSQYIQKTVYSRLQKSIENFVFKTKKAIFQRAGMREGGVATPTSSSYLILMIYRPCDSNLVMISSLASKQEVFKVEMTVFQLFFKMKLKTSKFKSQALHIKRIKY